MHVEGRSAILFGAALDLGHWGSDFSQGTGVPGPRYLTALELPDFSVQHSAAEAQAGRVPEELRQARQAGEPGHNALVTLSWDWRRTLLRLGTYTLYPDDSHEL